MNIQSNKDRGLITEEMLEELPQAVQRYLRYSGVVGTPWIETVRLKQVGTFRTGPTGRGCR
jgi:hypothetical protein